MYVPKTFTENIESSTAQKIKFSIKDFSSKCDQIRKNLRIWSHLLERSFMENFIFVQWSRSYGHVKSYIHCFNSKPTSNENTRKNSNLKHASGYFPKCLVIKLTRK